MKTFIFLLCSLPYFSHSQKICYEPGRYQSSHFPCDPGAAVSACCSPGATCATNLYCISPLGAYVVGSCTGENFDDPACPWPLNKTSATLNFDHFSYKLNTTTCPDQTICPSDDPRCCSQGRGKVEIRFHYNAAIPSAKSDLVSYYSAASYTTINLATTSLTSTLSASTILTTSATTTRPTTSPAPSSKQSNKAVQPGVRAAIGIALALCLSLPVAIIVYSRRCSQGRNRNDPEISSHKLNVYKERSATPDDEIAEAVRISRLNELPDSGRVIAAELDVRRQTQGGGFGPAELEGHDDTGGVGVLNKI